MKKQTVKIIVATHKKYKMPKEDMYMPLYVGAEGKKDTDGNNLCSEYAKDNTGDNISYLNASFCELTGLYWAWKNLTADYIGLVHYRRHFIGKKAKNPWDSVLSYGDIELYLGKVKVFVPKKRKYYIETLYSHYAHTHYSDQLDKTRTIIAEKHPAYIDSYDKVINHRYGYMFNMMIMQSDLLNEYCDWLFGILFNLREKIEESDLSAFQRRFCGRISEILFNVWLDQQVESKKLSIKEIKELSYVHMEKINWWKKRIAFLKAKFIGQKYERSF